MFTIGIIALLSLAEAAPKKSKDKGKEKEKTEQSKKSDGSKAKTSKPKTSKPKTSKPKTSKPKTSTATSPSKKSSPSRSSSSKSTSSASSKTSSPKPKVVAPKNNTTKSSAAKSTPSRTGSSKSSSNRSTTTVRKSSPTKSSQNTKRPSGVKKATENPAQQRVGTERSNKPTAHTPLGNTQTNGHRPTYERAPDNVERPQVGKEESNTPTAHTPIGTGERNGPTYERAPDNVDRPQVGKEESNTPTAHTPIGGSSTRPEKTPPTREPDGRVDRKPPTKKDPSYNRETRVPNTDAPTSGRVDRKPPSNGKVTRPNKERDPNTNTPTERSPFFDRDVPSNGGGQVGRTTPNKQGDVQPSTSAVSPGKSQCCGPASRGFSTSTRRTETSTSSRSSQNSQQGSIGFSTLSFASDYVEGGDYNDGGMGLSIGYRPVPQLEIEAAYGRYTDSTLESSRNRLNRPFQVVGQAHAFPNHVVSPFVLGGYVWNHIQIDDDYTVTGEDQSAEYEGVLTGLVLGAGLTFNIHQNVALQLDGRLFEYDNVEPWDDVGDTATLVSMGIVLGF